MNLRKFGLVLSSLAMLNLAVPTAAVTVAPHHGVSSTEKAGGSANGVANTAGVKPMDPAKLEALVDGIVTTTLDNEKIAGATVSIVQGDEVVLLKGYGLASVNPARAVDPEKSLFRIGSVSKTFTWLLLLRLVEEGKVKLDAPINDYLPAKLKIPAQGFSKPITVRDLLAHTTGFADTGFGHLFRDDPAKLMPREEYLATHRPERVREPGQFSTYSNYGVALAGEIIANIRGKDFETVAEEELFRPVGMMNSTFREPFPARAGLPAPMDAALAKNLAQDLAPENGIFKVRGFEYITDVAAAGSISTTAEDMAKYMLLLLNNGKVGDRTIFGPQTAKAIRTPIVNAPIGVNGWAHGFMVTDLPGGLKGYGHGGATQFFKSYMMVVPALDLGVFVSTNSPTGMALIERLPQEIVDQFYVGTKAEQRPGDPELVKVADKYTGTFQSTRRGYSGLEKFFTLVGGATDITVTPEGYLVVGSGPIMSAWVPTDDPSVFQSASGTEKIQLNLDAEGKVQSFEVPYGVARMERVGLLMNPKFLAVVAILVFIVSLISTGKLAVSAFRKEARAELKRRTAALSAGTSLVWFSGLAIAGIWAATLDPFKLLYTFPGGMLITASILSILGSVLAFALLASALWDWKQSAYSSKFKLFRQVAAAVLFIGFGLMLANWGFMSPWA